MKILQQYYSIINSLSLGGIALPTATNVAIDNTAPNLGDVITGSYTYNSNDGGTESTSTFRWLRNGTPIPGATLSTYTTVIADVGFPLSFEVTPVGTLQSGFPVQSALTNAVTNIMPSTTATLSGNLLTTTYTIADEPNVPPKINDIIITGTSQENEVLTATVDSSIFGPYTQLSTSYQWYAANNKNDDGTIINGATLPTYTIQTVDVGKFLYVQSTITQSGGLNNISDVFISRKTDVVLPLSSGASRTFKVNFGNNSVATVTGYNNMNGTNDDNSDFIVLNEDNGNTSTVTLTNTGSWTGATGSDTTNAGTGDLQADLLISNHRTGANSLGSREKVLSNLDTTKYYTIKITSVAASTDVTNYNSFFSVTGLTTTTEVTVDPVAQKAAPEIITIATNIQPTAGGIITLNCREPGAFDVILSTLILEETITQV